MILLIRNKSRNVNRSLVQLSTLERSTKRQFTCAAIHCVPRADIFTITKKIFSTNTITSRKLAYQQCEPTNYRSVLPEILGDLREIIYGHGGHHETMTWFMRALEYNLGRSQNNVAKFTIKIYESLMGTSKNDKPIDMRLVYILGWSTEIINTCALMFDDLMDNSSHRRGLQCWHKLQDVGMIGVNDAFMIEHAVCMLLKKHFRHLECYPSLLQLIHECTFIAVCGQSLDMTFGKKPVNTFNMETYKVMAANKIAFDHFYLPFALVMQLAGFTDEGVFRQYKTICLEIGLFFQIQNDFLDCFGTQQNTGKIGTDIQDNKYSWLAVTCMERGNDEQKQIMMSCYGKNDPAKIQRVKELYKILDLPGIYAAYEESSYNKTKSLLTAISNEVPPEIFLQIIDKVYRRHS